MIIRPLLKTLLLNSKDREMIDRWEGIDAFAAVAETRSFTRAAARLGISISQVSREISRLETRLEARLLVRTTRSVSISEAGKRFEQHCQRLIAEREAAFEAVSAEDSMFRGHIRLTCPVAYGEKTIVPIINRLAASHPALSVDIELTNRVLDISSEGFDFAIRVEDRSDKKLQRIPLASRTLHCCAAPSYLQRHGAPVSPRGLEHHKCLQGSSDHWRFKVGNRNMSVRPRGVWRCTSGFAVAQAAIQGLGICQLPDFYVAQQLRENALVEILTDFRPQPQQIWAVFLENGRQPNKVAALIEFIRLELAGTASQ